MDYSGNEEWAPQTRRFKGKHDHNSHTTMSILCSHYTNWHLTKWKNSWKMCLEAMTPQGLLALSVTSQFSLHSGHHSTSGNWMELSTEFLLISTLVVHYIMPFGFVLHWQMQFMVCWGGLLVVYRYGDAILSKWVTSTMVLWNTFTPWIIVMIINLFSHSSNFLCTFPQKPTIQIMSAQEKTFYSKVEELLSNVTSPEYRQLLVEVGWIIYHTFPVSCHSSSL